MSLEKTVKDHNAGHDLHLRALEGGRAGHRNAKADLLALRDYFTAMLDYVQKGIAAGKSADEIVKGGLPAFASNEARRSCRWPTTSCRRRDRRSQLSRLPAKRVSLPKAHPLRSRAVGVSRRDGQETDHRDGGWRLLHGGGGQPRARLVRPGADAKADARRVFSRDGEWRRRWLHREVLRRFQGTPLSALDDGAAAHFVGRTLTRIVSSRAQAKGYAVIGHMVPIA